MFFSRSSVFAPCYVPTLPSYTGLHGAYVEFPAEQIYIIILHVLSPVNYSVCVRVETEAHNQIEKQKVYVCVCGGGGGGGGGMQ